MAFLKSFIEEEEGQDLVEYALLLGFVAVACVTAVTIVGTKVSAYFNKVGTKLPS